MKKFLLITLFCMSFNFASLANDFAMNALTETNFTEVLQQKTDKLYILENKVIDDEVVNAINENKTITGWHCIKNENGDTDWVWTDSNENIVKNKWILSNDEYYYLNGLGKMVKNSIVHIDEHDYGFSDSGKLQIGKFILNDVEYFSNEDGVLYKNQWVNDNDKWIYVDDNGSILKNQKTPDDYDVDDNGYLIEKKIQNVANNAVLNYNGLQLKIGTATQIWNYLKDNYGWTDTAIAGLLGNFQQESQVDPNYLESNGIGYGLGQWSFERRNRLESYMSQRGVPKSDLYAQLDYLMIEAGESAFVKQYSQTNFNSVSDAVYSWMKNWERCNPKKSAFERVRVPYGNAFYEYFTNIYREYNSDYNYNRIRICTSVSWMV